MYNRARIEAAAHRSGADEVAAGLPLGYDQLIGRRFKTGVDLSGGQWQKVAIARAYMRDAQVMILDEPTAALDARAEVEMFPRFPIGRASCRERVCHDVSLLVVTLTLKKKN